MLIISNQIDLSSFHIPPGGSDESLPLGACYLVTRSHTGKWHPLENAYLGPDTNPSSVKNIIQKSQQAGLYVMPDTPDVVAAFLANGGTVGRCCGRMEFGPRALGNRSILAKADDAAMVQKLNDQVKHRDWWMPFAPIVQASKALH